MESLLKNYRKLYKKRKEPLLNKGLHHEFFLLETGFLKMYCNKIFLQDYISMHIVYLNNLYEY